MPIGRPFTRCGDDYLRSPSTGAVDLGCQLPSPALLLSTAALSFDIGCWRHFGGEDGWRLRFAGCTDAVKHAARVDADRILKDRAIGDIAQVQRLAESAALCALMDEMRTIGAHQASMQELDRIVAVDTPLAEALSVRRTNAPSELCHEVVVSSMDHEVKSITGYKATECYCYPRVPSGQSCVAVGGVCLKSTHPHGDTFMPLVPGKLVVFKAQWMSPWTAFLCLVGATNTLLMVSFLLWAPWTGRVTATSPLFWFLGVNVALEFIAVGVGWGLEHRLYLGWKKYLVRFDPFHAILTAESNDALRVAYILALEAAGGAASVAGLAFTSGVPMEVLSSLLIPMVTACLAKGLSGSPGFKASLVVGAMSLYLLEFVYEIVVMFLLDDFVLGWVVIVSCILESASLLWLISTILFAIQYLSAATADSLSLLGPRAPARIRDGTLAGLRLPDLPSGGLMCTTAQGSKVLPNNFIPDGGSAIKEGSVSYRGWLSDERPSFGGWLSLTTHTAVSPFVDPISLVGRHSWLGDVVVACGLVIPVLG